jgi:4-diphosphocytidyl-2-C-methyl-D-erythritol kinase
MSSAQYCLGKEEVTLLSPAKVNLFFRVLSRRSDGYHEIASLYQTVNFFDTMVLALSDSDSLTCTDSRVACDATNLIFKALAVFRKKTNWDASFRVHLEKKIPIQAGLGGGSSNAATMLWGLSRLSGLNIPDEQLGKWAAEFSSDASFFFSHGTAYCTGRGEMLECLPPLAQTHFWLAKPKEGLSTPLVYQRCLAESFAKRNPREYLEWALHGNIQSFNDLESPAFQLMPSLRSLKDTLLTLGFSHVTMTGSGTAMMCFGPVENPSLDGIHFYPVSFLNRTASSWYC